MNIFLDENMPEGLVNVLRKNGHTVESINSLHKKGIDNGLVQKHTEGKFDILFTRDAEFSRRFKKQQQTKIVLVTIQQGKAKAFIPIFMEHFEETDWSRIRTGDPWPFVVPD